MKTLSSLVLLSVIIAASATPICQLPLGTCFKSWCDMNNSKTAFTAYQKGNLSLYSSHNIQDLGDYQQCIKATETNRYILGQFTDLNTSQSFLLALCGPVNCTADDYNKLYPEIKDWITWMPEIQDTNATFMNPLDFEPESDFAQVLAIIVISGCVVMGIAGSMIGSLTREKKKKSFAIPSDEAGLSSENTRDNPSLYQSLMPFMDELDARKPLQIRILECFDIGKNYEGLIKDEKKPGQDEGINVFSGLRFLAFCWVCYGHTLSMLASQTKNPGALLDFEGSWWFLIVYAALYAVDIFFFLSGFLAAFIIINKVSKMPPSPQSYLKIVLHRIFRLWPAYFVCILIFWRIVPYMGDGPLWFQEIQVSNQCDNNWWHNLLFIDNLLDTDPTDPYCFGWGWYIAVDMQLFLLVPIICWAYNYSKLQGRLLITALFVISTIGAYGYAISNNYPYEIPPNDLTFAAWRFFYINPIVRAAPYILGCLFGILYQKFKSGEEKNFFHTITEQKCLAYILSMIGFTITLLIVFLPRGPQTSGEQWADWWGYTWQAFDRPIYTLGLFLWVAPTLVGYIGTLKSILTCGFFTMFGKLTYSAYLVHYMVIMVCLLSIPQFLEFTNEAAIYKTLAFITLTFTFAPFIYLFVEKPFANLENTILNPKPRKIVADPEDKRSIAENRGSIQDTN